MSKPIIGDKIVGPNNKIETIDAIIKSDTTNRYTIKYENGGGLVVSIARLEQVEPNVWKVKGGGKTSQDTSHPKTQEKSKSQIQKTLSIIYCNQFSNK
jgi:trehalose-6-phosphate synthase